MTTGIAADAPVTDEVAAFWLQQAELFAGAGDERVAAMAHAVRRLVHERRRLIAELDSWREAE